MLVPDGMRAGLSAAEPNTVDGTTSYSQVALTITLRDATDEVPRTRMQTVWASEHSEQESFGTFELATERTAELHARAAAHCVAGASVSGGLSAIQIG